MLMIRLQRTGRRNEPHFRIVVTEKTTSPRGKYLESLGYVNPLEKKRSVNKERALYWISKGAQPSATVTNVLVSEKIIDTQKIPNHKKSKKPAVAEKQAAPVAPATPVA
ncbi:30S ribosomal protein S16 [Candidatus Azambacteria bacterium]|nr:30S ribosomal protein S16 [Candidatus Azambacteria bacterium]MBI3685558.1 30S ribosomal protein S16 [Candidatus Azambacteria bacterium]